MSDEKRIPNTPPTPQRLKDFVQDAALVKVVGLIQPARNESFMSHMVKQDADDLVISQMVLAEIATMALARISKPKLSVPEVSSESINWALDTIKRLGLTDEQNTHSVKSVLGIADVAPELSEANRRKYLDRRSAAVMAQSAG